MTKLIGMVLLLFFGIKSFSQSTEKTLYTLKECIAIALENNTDVQTFDLATNTALINNRQAKTNLLPQVSADYNIGINNGRSIDPYTNDFIDQQLNFSNARVNLNAVIFNGFKLINTIRQNRLNLQAAEMEAEKSKQNLILNVTLTYLQILNKVDLLTLSKTTLETTEKQLNRLEILFKEEGGNPADYANIQGQIATDKINIIETENSVEQSLINLKTLLNKDLNFRIKNLDSSINNELYSISLEQVFNDAMAQLPAFKEQKLRVEAAKRGISIAQSFFAPEISFFTQLNTTYSSAGQLFKENGSQLIKTGDYVSINNQNHPIMRNEQQFVGEKISYNDQFKNNFNSVVGIAITIPLFSGFDARNKVALERIKWETANLTWQKTQMDFKLAIEQAYKAMLTSHQKSKVLQEQVNAFEEAFRVNEIRFQLGATNFVNYVTSKNNFESSKTSLINAQYEYFLRVKILEYYRGNV